MNCEDAQAAFASHLDGEELGPKEAEALEGHLADCSACGAQARKAAATHRDLLLLRAMEAVSKEPVPFSSVEQRGASTATASQPARRSSVWIEAAAAMLLAAVLAFLLWPTGQPTKNGTVGGKDTDPVAPTVAQSVSRLGRVSACQGKVEGKIASDAPPAGLEPGTDLVSGQEIHTAQDSFAVLDLADGPVIRLEASSVLRLGSSDKPKWVLLLRGRGRLELKKRDEPWHVQTPNATVETHESVFFVSVDE